jgi:hypothetical protein
MESTDEQVDDCLRVGFAIYLGIGGCDIGGWFVPLGGSQQMH